MAPRRGFLHARRPPLDLCLIVALRLWQAGAGLCTTVLAIHVLTPELQGWYYSFLSVASLYTLFDLGLSTVLVQVSAHAFLGLRWTAGGCFEGAGATRFASLLSQSVRWYALLALVFALLLLPGGWCFFGANANAQALSGLTWAPQWLLLGGLSAAALPLMPFMALLEGSGRIAQVYGVRLAQAMCGSLACWAVLLLGGKLWASAMTAAMAVCVPLLWLAARHRPLMTIARDAPPQRWDWRREVWPLQWRLGVSWLCAYLLSQINVPILFEFQGSVAAGQFGLSLAVVNTVGLIAQSWYLRRVPSMAQAASRSDWPCLDRIFWRNFAATVMVFWLGAAAILMLDLLLPDITFVRRLLPWPQLLGLLVFAFVGQVIGALSAQLRSFRREPLVWLNLCTTILTLPATIFAARLYSCAGLVAVLAGVNVAVNLPASILIWRYCNRSWRVQT